MIEGLVVIHKLLKFFAVMGRIMNQTVACLDPDFWDALFVCHVM